MRAKTNTITINGRTYDAITGRAVSAGTKNHQTHHEPVVMQPSTKTKTTIQVTDHQTVAQKNSPRGERIAVRVLRRQPDRSHTLMRKAVKRPTSTKATHGVAGLVAQPKHTVYHNGKITNADAHRTTYTKSQLISKFGPRPSVKKVTAHLPVAPVPNHSSSKPTAYDISNIPPAPHLSPQRPLKEIHRDLFDTALHNAASHKQAKVLQQKHKKHRRAARLTIAAASLVLLAAFFAYQSAPNIALKRASSSIGFSASMPSYHPSGFRQSGPVQYRQGSVVINFRSNSDDRTYSVTQSNAYFDDQSLRQNFLANKPFETVQANGQTGYLYNRGNLTWVRNGIWYNIQGNAQLSRDQLLKVASSLF